MDLLPATIDCRDSDVEEFVRAACAAGLKDREFILMPAYLLYMATRHNLLHNDWPANYQMKRIAKMSSTAAQNICDIMQVFSILCFLCRHFHIFLRLSVF